MLALDRRQTYEDLQHTVKIAAKYQIESDGIVVGVDLSGDFRVSFLDIEKSIYEIYYLIRNRIK